MLEEKLLDISPWKRGSHLGCVPLTLISFSDPMTPATFAFDSMVALTVQCPSMRTIIKTSFSHIYVQQIISYLKDDEDTSVAILSLSRSKMHYDILLKKQVLPLK